MISQPKNVDDYEIKLNIPVIILITIVIFLIFYVVDLKTKIKCYQAIDRDNCNLIYKK